MLLPLPPRIHRKCWKIPVPTLPLNDCCKLVFLTILVYKKAMCCHDAENSFLCNWHIILTSQRLYKSVYEQNKMKIHTVPDMVEMVTAKDSQKKVSEIDYRLHLHEWICHPDLQVNSHVRKVTDQISDVSPLLTNVSSPQPHMPILKRNKLTYFFTSAFFQYRFFSITMSPTGIQSCPWKQGSVCQCFHGTLDLIA